MCKYVTMHVSGSVEVEVVKKSMTKQIEKSHIALPVIQPWNQIIFSL